MDTKTNTVETKQDAGPAKVEGASTTTTTVEDAEAKIARLEAEKAKIVEERDNYRTGLLKAKNKNPELNIDDETEDEKLRRIVREESANSQIAELAREQDLIIKQALKENKELKLAGMNRTTTPTSMGTHTESLGVTSTIITPEQMNYFKSLGWNDQKIEAYKKNLNKGGGR